MKHSSAKICVKNTHEALRRTCRLTRHRPTVYELEMLSTADLFRGTPDPPVKLKRQSKARVGRARVPLFVLYLTRLFTAPSYKARRQVIS